MPKSILLHYTDGKYREIGINTNCEQESKLNGTSMHSVRRLYQCQSNMYFTFMSKITKYNRRHRELNHRPEDYQSMTLPTDQLVRYTLI